MIVGKILVSRIQRTATQPALQVPKPADQSTTSQRKERFFSRLRKCAVQTDQTAVFGHFLHNQSTFDAITIWRTCFFIYRFNIFGEIFLTLTFSQTHSTHKQTQHTGKHWNEKVAELAVHFRLISGHSDVNQCTTC